MNHYDILEVHRNASTEVIKAAYRILAQKYHPDKNSSEDAPEKMAKINDAYNILSDSIKRKEYDKDLEIEEILNQMRNKEGRFAREEPKETSDKSKKQDKPAKEQSKSEDKKKETPVKDSATKKEESKVKEKTQPVEKVFSKQEKKEFLLRFIKDSLIKDQAMILSRLNSGASVKRVYQEYIPRKEKKNISFTEFSKIMNEVFLIMNPNGNEKRINKKATVVALICLGIFISSLLPQVQNEVRKSFFYTYNVVQQYRFGPEYTYNYGVKSYREGRVEEAISTLELAAYKEYIPAYDFLGKIYMETKNYTQAMKWFNLAVQKNDAFAQFSLGMIYSEGLGISKNYVQAAKWYELSANQGYGFAQNNYANLLELGLGVKKDSMRAIQFYSLAAKQNHPIAQYNLGLKHLKGEGVTQDYAEGIRLLKLSASQGTELAKRKLKEIGQ
jgi:curved DNA-binding protein CbpA